MRAGVFRYYAEMARDEAGKIAGTTQAGSFQYARYEPYGVSVHIMPYNFPILLMCWTVAASLAAGNACIIKPAEATTLSTLEYMKMFRSLPPGLVSCLPGGAATAQALIASDRTHAVAFTGSVAAGTGRRRRLRRADEALRHRGRRQRPDDRHRACAAGGRGGRRVTAAFHLSGQVCTSAERFFVVDAVHDRFVDAVRRADAGAAHRQRHGRERDRPAGQRGGARQGHAAGRRRASRRAPPRSPAAACRRPAMSAGSTSRPSSPASRPTWRSAARSVSARSPRSAGCSDFDEAIRLANDSPFGLGASVFTTDLAEAMEAAERLEAGMVWVNNPLIDNDALPFGGWKASGLGRELGRQGLDAFRRSKMVVIDHKPAIQDWWYPYPDAWFPKHGGRKHV